MTKDPLPGWPVRRPGEDDSLASRASAPSLAAEAIAHTPRLERLSILIVDDAPANADALRELLGLEGAHVDVATSAADALARLASRRFDALISDLVMPGMSGLELVAAMRACELNRDTPAIAYSGYGSRFDSAESRAAGFDAQLVKPAGLDAFVEAILRCLRAR